MIQTKDMSHQQIIYLGNQSDLIAEQCAWMYRAPDVLNSEGQPLATNNDCRKETFVHPGIHPDHFSK
jgi:hypothetical protein